MQRHRVGGRHEDETRACVYDCAARAAGKGDSGPGDAGAGDSEFPEPHCVRNTRRIRQVTRKPRGIDAAEGEFAVFLAVGGAGEVDCVDGGGD